MISKEVKFDLNRSIGVNPSIVFREEADNWALLFEPESGKTFTLNPVSVLIWKQLSNHCTVNEVLEIVRSKCVQVPDGFEKDVSEFLEQLLEKNFLHYDEVANRKVD